MNFVVGRDIKVTVKTKEINIFATEPFRYTEYTGKVVKNDRWVTDENVSIFTGNPNYPVSVIRKDMIVGFEQGEPSKTRFFSVKSKSKGTEYTVTLHDSVYKCNCIGFSYRNSCKHTKNVAKFVALKGQK